METTFTAPGISCQGCANTIERALGSIPDVSRVSVDVTKKSVTVSHGDRVERKTLEAALARAGYPAASGGHDHHQELARGAAAMVIDPVCGMDVDRATAAGKSNHAGTTYFFCSTSCKQKFDSEPTRYLSARGGQPIPPPKSPEGVLYTCPMHPEIVRDKPGSCPICGMALEPKTATEDDTNPQLV
ncbi:MAG: YHS domain-containing protein, partial [Isosphaeraceae bacterium]